MNKTTDDFSWIQFEANQVDKAGEAEEEAGGISLLGKAGKQGVL